MTPHNTILHHARIVHTTPYHITLKKSSTCHITHYTKSHYTKLNHITPNHAPTYYPHHNTFNQTNSNQTTPHLNTFNQTKSNHTTIQHTTLNHTTSIDSYYTSLHTYFTKAQYFKSYHINQHQLEGLKSSMKSWIVLLNWMWKH